MGVFFSNTMKFVIDTSVVEKFPEVKIGLLVVRGLDNSGEHKEVLAHVRTIEQGVRGTLDVQTLADHPKIQDWRAAYSAFGAKPKTYKNSVEALLRRVLKGDTLPDINTVVNVYNSMSIKHILPAGGDDMDNIEGDLRLTIAAGGEPFTMLGSQEQEQVESGEVIYRDDTGVLCRRWNWRECDKTKMTAETKNVCLVLEGLQSTTQEELSLALEELKGLITTYCGGNAKTFILDKNTNEVKLDE